MKQIYTLLILLLSTSLIKAQDIDIVDNPVCQPYIPPKVTYIPSFDVDSYQINRDLPVGTTSSSWAVAPTGAVTYSIPIYTPPGTSGVQPNISIEYNSQKGDGLLGIGWEIKGLSSITRDPKIFHRDGTAEPIQFSDGDRYALDGNRLILKSLYPLEYSTETENSLKIQATPITGTFLNPLHFTVKNGDGWELEYGRTNDSRTFLLDAKDIYMWRLNKSTDPNGNYITYEYETYSGESRIKKISYTGNTGAGIVPYNSIEFIYKQRRDIDTVEMGKYKYIASKLLDRIEVRSEGALVRIYTFKYSPSGYNSTAQSYLSMITEYAGDGSLMNPINISWENKNTQRKLIDVYIPNLCNGVYTGDFNGDGKADMVTHHYTNNYLEFYLSTTDSLTYQYHKLSTPRCYGVLASDIDNDGLDDIILSIATEDGVPIKFRPYFSRIEDGSFNIVTFGHVFQSEFRSWDPPELLIGNFDGSGNKILWVESELDTIDYTGILKPKLTSFIRQADGSITSESIYLTHISHKITYKCCTAIDWNKDGISELELTGRYMPEVGSIRHLVGETFVKCENYPNPPGKGVDMDGDGIRETVITSGDSIYIYKYITQGGEKELDTCISKAKLLELADFDGDGNIDILYQDKITQQHKIFLLGGHKPHLMRSVTDGLGQTTYFEYKSLSDTSVYEKESDALYPLMDMKDAMYVASEVRIPNNAGSHDTISYHYKGGKINLQGLGFLGFKEVTESYPFAGKKLKNYFEFNAPYYTPTLSKSEAYDMYANKRIFCDSIIYEYEKDSDGTFRLYVSKTFNYNEMSNERTETQYTYDALSGKPATTQTKYYPSLTGNVPEYEKTETYYTYKTRYRNLRTPDSLRTVFKKGNVSEESHAYFTYDAKGNVTKKTRYKGDPVLEFSQETEYTPTGAVQKETVITTAGQRETLYEYDPKYRWQTKVTAPGNFVTQYTYDNKYGNILTETSAGGLTTQYRYNAWGQLMQETYPDGNWSKDTLVWFSSAYPLLENSVYKKTVTSSIAETVEQYYDAKGQELLSSQQDHTDTYYTFTQYDTQGRVTIKTMPQNTMNLSAAKYFCIQYEYDQISGNLLREKEYIKQSSKIIKEGLRTDISYGYDYANRTDTVKNHITGVTTISKKDLMGNVVEVTDAKGTVGYEYSPRGKVLSVSALGTQTTYAYDRAGNRTAWNDPNAGTVTYQYNGFQELVSQTDAAGTVTSYLYNNAGQLTSKTITSVSGETEAYTYTYMTSGPAKGRLQKATNNNHTVTTSYDAYGCEKEITDKIGEKTFTSQYEYNEFQKLNTVYYPKQSSETAFAVSYSYNNNKGSLSKIQANNSDLWKKVSVNPYRQIKEVLHGNGVKTIYNYESETQRISMVRIFSKSMMLSHWEYTYDRGLMKTRHDAVSNQTETFTYDNALRLTDVTHRDMQTNLRYSQEDNLTHKSDVGDMTYETGASSHALGVLKKAAPMRGIHEELYNAQKCHTEYTPFHKIKKIYNEKGDTLLFTYGVDQQRVKTVLKRSGKETVTTWFVNGLSEYEETPSYQLQRHYVQGDRWVAVYVKDSRFAKATKDSMYYIFTDHLGSYERITNEQGALIAKQSFDAWGNRRNPTYWKQADNSDTRLFARGFTGHEHLDDFQLINMNGRLYDPISAQFLSPDPLREAYPNTSPYAYCAHDPINYTDPTGLYLNESEATWQGRRELPWKRTGGLPIVDSKLQTMMESIQGMVQAFQDGIYLKILQRYMLEECKARMTLEYLLDPITFGFMETGGDGIGNVTSQGDKKEKIVIITDDSPIRLINNSEEVIYFKPDDKTVYNGITYDAGGAYKLNPGESTRIPIDGVNIGGNVYKISDGYNYTIVLPGGMYDVYYPSIFLEMINDRRGGRLKSYPDDGWKALFNSIKLNN